MTTPTAPPGAESAVDDPDVRTALAMITVIILWGIGPSITKLISAPAVVAVTARLWLQVLILWGWTAMTHRRVDVGVIRQTAVAGMLFGVNHLFIFEALQHASIAVISVILALQPAAVLLVAAPLLGERITQRQAVWTGIGTGGAAIVVLGGDRSVETDGYGLALAVAAMATLAAYYMLTRRARSASSIGASEWMTGATLCAALTVTPVMLLTSSGDDYGSVGAMDVVYMLVLAGVVGAVGHTTMSWTHRFIPALRSSLYLLAMNVVAVVAAWIVHGEPLTILQGIGGAVVLGAIAAVLTTSYSSAE